MFMLRKGIVVHLKNGLQARSAKEFVQRASFFNSEVNIVKNGRTVNGKSIMGVMATAIRSGEKLKLITEGNDEQDAIQSLEGFLSNKN